MGACATKPKVFKGDEVEVPPPVPPPEPTKERVPAVPEAKEAAYVIAEGEKKVEADVIHKVVKAKDVDEAEEVVNDDKVDDQANKRQSLSNLFKEVFVSNSPTLYIRFKAFLWYKLKKRLNLIGILKVFLLLVLVLGAMKVTINYMVFRCQWNCLY